MLGRVIGITAACLAGWITAEIILKKIEHQQERKKLAETEREELRQKSRSQREYSEPVKEEQAVIPQYDPEPLIEKIRNAVYANAEIIRHNVSYHRTIKSFSFPNTYDARDKKSYISQHNTLDITIKWTDPETGEYFTASKQYSDDNPKEKTVMEKIQLGDIKTVPVLIFRDGGNFISWFMVICPECGKLLVKDEVSGNQYCENGHAIVS